LILFNTKTVTDTKKILIAVNTRLTHYDINRD